MTTEHFTLQSARNILNSEITSRVSSFFTFLSSVLVASAFLVQFQTDQELFFLFSIVAFPILLLVGFVTFLRMMQLSYLDHVYIRAINRIRHFYLDAAPEIRPYLLFPPFDDALSVSKYAGYRFSAKGNLFYIAALVGVMNSILVMVLLGIILNTFYLVEFRQLLPLGIVVVSAFIFLQGFAASRIVRGELHREYLEVRFPDVQENPSQASKES